jgi:hypothetical protein
MIMKKIISSLLFLTLLLSACSPADSTPETVVTESPSVESTAVENNDQLETNREAVLSEIENDVSAQIKSTAEFSSANVGLVIPVGGTIQTGDDSRAKLSLNPEGTIVRVGPNSSFTLSQITEENGEPKTTLQLLFGKVFVLLNGGSLDVETPSGVASVRGSLLSVQYDPDTNRVRASCLEGECALENEEGEEVEMTEGESVFIDEEGDLSELNEIDQDEIEDWLDENPDLDEFMDELPDPEDYPDFDDDEWYEEDEFSGEEESFDEEEEFIDEGEEESSDDE